MCTGTLNIYWYIMPLEGYMSVDVQCVHEYYSIWSCHLLVLCKLFVHVINIIIVLWCEAHIKFYPISNIVTMATTDAKRKRSSHTAAFKLNVVEFAEEEEGNRAAEREFSV